MRFSSLRFFIRSFPCFWEHAEKNGKNLLHHFMTALKKTDLPVIDEAGFTPLRKDASELLFQVISDCYERKSLIITSNLEFS